MNSCNKTNSNFHGSNDMNDLLRLLCDNLCLLLTKNNEIESSDTIGEKDAHKLKALLEKIDEIQKTGDNLISLMSPAHRKYFNHNVPEFFAMLGWEGRIDNNGNIIHDA